MISREICEVSSLTVGGAVVAWRRLSTLADRPSAVVISPLASSRLRWDRTIFSEAARLSSPTFWSMTATSSCRRMVGAASPTTDRSVLSPDQSWPICSVSFSLCSNSATLSSISPNWPAVMATCVALVSMPSELFTAGRLTSIRRCSTSPRLPKRKIEIAVPATVNAAISMKAISSLPATL